MKRRQKKSIVFIYPDYHCSFIYRDELRRLGWTADIYVPVGFPQTLLYGEPDLEGPQPASNRLMDIYIAGLRTQWLYLKLVRKYRYHFYNGNLEHFTLFERIFRLDLVLGKSFRVNLFFARIFGCKILYHPSGAPDEEMPNVIAALGNDEEGVAVRDSRLMKVHFDTLRRYSHLNIGYGLLDSTQYKATHMKYRSIDLDLWNSNIDVPPQFRLQPTLKIRILHSFMFGEQRMRLQGGNIKGSKYVAQAVEQLLAEGYEIELISFGNVPTQHYKFYQVQADIIVEELIRGSWGSTAVECMSLGKPVVTYIRPDWEERYYRLFPETYPLPLVNANKWTIYNVLKRLLDDAQLRKSIGQDSRSFAENHLNPAINVRNFANFLVENL